ncbi:MAG: glycosyltransferase family 9 protein [Saprospiraceae bacterium]|nr:glycosyltransferase family 9 protein [Saprospiraceae bacterium]
MKILVIRFSSIGDILLCTPVIRCLKKQRNAEVHFLTASKNSALLSNNPYLDQIISCPDGISACISRLKMEQYDLVVDLHKNRKSTLIGWLLKSRVVTFDKLNFKKWVWVNFKFNSLRTKHLVDRYFDALSAIGLKDDGEGLDYFMNPATTKFALPAKYNVLVLGAAHFTKRIPSSLCAAWLDASSLPVVLLGGEDVATDGKKLEASHAGKVVNMTGKLSLDQSALVLQGAAFIVTGDTGLMHMAAALRKPMRVVWGNTAPEFGMFPYYGYNQSIRFESSEVIGLSCRPCSKIGFGACPKGHFRCMNDQQVIPW